MREIKFRAWHDIEGMTSPWLVVEIGNTSQAHVSKPKAIMQFTGLKDLNGNDIYEGDILELDINEWGGNDNIFVVSWDSTNGCWDTGGGLNGECKDFKRVIGNIYQNPELLEEI